MKPPRSLNLDETEPDAFLVAVARYCQEAHDTRKPVVAAAIFGGERFQVIILRSDAKGSQNAPTANRSPLPRPPDHELLEP